MHKGDRRPSDPVDDRGPAALATVVASALSRRKNGATDAEVQRVTRTLVRLQPAADQAQAEGPARTDDFAGTLESLADV